MGKVYIVGAGPGDKDLITVKGLKCIQQAEVILYDRLVNIELLDEAKPYADLIYCGKTPHHHSMSQESINRLLVRYAKSGKTVTRLKGGDPFIFGRGGEEAEALVKHGIEFEVVPGITSGIAAPAYAGIPVTHRELSASFAIITGHRKQGDEDKTNWKSLATGVDTLAIYMGVGNLPYIISQLLKYKKAPQTPVAIIHQGTTGNQLTITGTLQTIVEIAQAEKVRNPSMIVIGEVVKFRETLQPFEVPLDENAVSL